MDLVTKKVLEAKVKHIGKELGIGDGLGGTPSTQQERSRTFDLGNNEYDEFPVQAVSYFDNMRNNFPPILNLFYYDSSILSDKVKVTVRWAYHVFLAIEVLLVFNLLSVVVKTVKMKGQGWLFIVLSILVGIVVTVFELLAFDTAFRGAYRTNPRLRLRYIYLSSATLVLCGIYAFTGAAWFNGWARVAQYSEARTKTPDDSKSSEAELLGTVGIVFSVIESLGWTAALFLVTFTLFDFYHLWKDGNQGLSEEALRLAQSNGRGRTNEASVDDGSLSERSDRYRTTPNVDRIEEIRNKYASRS